MCSEIAWKFQLGETLVYLTLVNKFTLFTFIYKYLNFGEATLKRIKVKVVSISISFKWKFVPKR